MTKNLETLTWKQIRAEVKHLTPSLAKFIDDIDPSDEYVIYKLKCPWGKHLLHEGILCLPNENGTWVKIDDSSIVRKIAEDLSYNDMNMPLGIVLKGSMELHINALGRIVPWVLMSPGKLFGSWYSLEQKPVADYYGKTSQIIAGSRSTLFLPKISDATSFKRLKKAFGIQSKVPEKFIDQWPLLLELAEHKDFPQEWNAEVIYFSKKWLELKDDVAWKLFRNHLLEIAWENTSHMRKQGIFDLAFSCALEEKNLKPNPYLTDTVKHIFAIAQNGYPGYEVAIDNSVVPLDAFQKIFAEIYESKYKPTMIIPGYLNSNPSKSIYHSLEIPTLMAFSPKSRQSDSKLEDLREVKHIIQRIIDYLREDQLRLKQTPLYKLIDEVSFEYYHINEDMYDETLKTVELLKVDENMIKENQKYKDREFCNTSPFLRGCVRLSMKKSVKLDKNNVL